MIGTFFKEFTYQLNNKVLCGVLAESANHLEQLFFPKSCLSLETSFGTLACVVGKRSGLL